MDKKEIRLKNPLAHMSRWIFLNLIEYIIFTICIKIRFLLEYQKILKIFRNGFNRYFSAFKHFFKIFKYFLNGI